MEFLNEIVFWHWLIFGVVVMALEILAPGAVFLWIGIAAILTGALLFLMPGTGWEFQIFIFAVLSAISIYIGRKFIAGKPGPSDHPTLNQRGAGYIGQTYTLAEPIRDGIGKLVIDDTSWRVHGQDMPKGTRVKVIGMDGATLVVEQHQAG